MSAAELVTDLAARRIALLARNGAIVAKPAGSLAEAEVALIREHKAELLAFLTNHGPQEEALPVPVEQPAPAPLDPRQVVAAEGLRTWGEAGGPEHESREVAIKLPGDLGIVHVLPERTGAARCEVTWRELAADPLGTVAGVRAVLGAVRELAGRILPAHDDRATELARWDPDTRRRITWLEALAPGDLPPAPFRLAGHQTVTEPARFLASLRASVAEGPVGGRARTRALQADLAALEALVAGRAEL